MFRLKLVLIVVAIGSIGQSGFAQVLDLEKKDAADKQPIRLTGVMVEQKKYSFSIKADDLVYEVKVPRGTPVSMKLNRPNFDFSSSKVWVTPVPAKNDQAISTANQKPPAQIDFELPQPAYLNAQFAHAAQMKRVMSSNVLRLNNYTIQPSDPGPKKPSADDTPIEIAGKIEPANDPKQPVLVVGEQRYEVILGHRGATMAGLSIAMLDPAKVRLAITGTLEGERKVTATSIELIPVAPAPKK